METQEVEVMSLESKIDFELKKVNLTEAVLSDLKNRYGNLRLSSVDDKEKYLEIKDAIKECSKWRNLAMKICKSGREEAIAIQKKWVNREKIVVGAIREVEEPLDEEVNKFEYEIERKEKEKKRLQEEAYIQRQAMLTRMGAIYSDGSFVLGDVSFEAALIKDADEETWMDTVVKKFEIEYGKIESVKIEEQRRKDAAEAELKRQREEFAREKAELEKQMAELRQQKEEIARAERERSEAEEREKQQRRNELQNKRLTLIMPFKPSGIDTQSLWNMSETAFNEVLELKRAEFEKETEERERFLREKWLADQAKKQAEEAEKKQRELEEAERQRQTRLDQANDKDKWQEVMEHLERTPLFEMRSSHYRSKMKIVRDFLDDIKNK